MLYSFMPHMYILLLLYIYIHIITYTQRLQEQFVKLEAKALKLSFRT